MKYLLLAISFAACLHPRAQQTEFPKEYISHLKIATGLITHFDGRPDLFAAELRFVPQYTLVPHRLRGGAVLGATYAEKELAGMLGPTLSLNLFSLRNKTFGSLGNLHLNLDHLWSTDKRRRVGGGLNLDLLNKLVLGINAHRDYKQPGWWFTSAIGFRTSKVKKPVETFPH